MEPVVTPDAVKSPVGERGAEQVHRVLPAGVQRNATGVQREQADVHNVGPRGPIASLLA